MTERPRVFAQRDTSPTSELPLCRKSTTWAFCWLRETAGRKVFHFKSWRKISRRVASLRSRDWDFVVFRTVVQWNFSRSELVWGELLEENGREDLSVPILYGTRHNPDILFPSQDHVGNALLPTLNQTYKFQMVPALRVFGAVFLTCH